MNVARNQQLDTLKAEIRQFAEENLVHNLEERDVGGIFLEENWQACAAKGIFGLYVPREYGGSGYDMVTTVGMLEFARLRLSG